MKVCWHCHKIIRGTMKLIVPSNLAIALGDFVRAYHPACYRKAELEAGRELRGE